MIPRYYAILLVYRNYFCNLFYSYVISLTVRFESSILEIVMLIKIIHRAYDAIDDIFTDGEAWFLFRASAFLETFGWTLLIIGIVFSHYHWAGYDYILPISGSIHGVFYLIYVFIVFFSHRSMKWSVWRFIIAELLSTVPYGALVFERWVTKRRRSGKI